MKVRKKMAALCIAGALSAPLLAPAPASAQLLLGDLSLPNLLGVLGDGGGGVLGTGVGGTGGLANLLRDASLLNCLAVLGDSGCNGSRFGGSGTGPLIADRGGQIAFDPGFTDPIFRDDFKEIFRPRPVLPPVIDPRFDRFPTQVPVIVPAAPVQSQPSIIVSNNNNNNNNNSAAAAASAGPFGASAN